MAFWKESMINRLSNLINRNRSAAKISQVLCSSAHACTIGERVINAILLTLKLIKIVEVEVWPPFKF